MPKPGFITASQFSTVMQGSRTKGEIFGETAKKYAARLACDIIGVDTSEIPEITARALEHGKLWEPVAVAAYIDATLYNVTNINEDQVFLIHPELPYVGGHPDGLVNADGILEVKNPDNIVNHFFNAIDGLQIKQYTPQIQGLLSITGRGWCDFVSYDYRYPKGNNISIKRVYRDEDYIEVLESRFILFRELIEELINKFNSSF
jgi:hypothetical protein